MRLRVFEKRRGVIGERRTPQDFDAALLLAPISHLEYRVAQLIAYRQFQFSRDEDPSTGLLVEDFMGIGPGIGRTAVFDALSRLEGFGIVIRTRLGGGRARPSRYAVEPNPYRWLFPETVHPSGRFDVIPYREAAEVSAPETVRPSGPFQSAPADGLAGNRPPQWTKPSAPADPHKETSSKHLSSNLSQAHAPLQASGATSSSPPRPGQRGEAEETGSNDVWTPPNQWPPVRRG